MRLILTLLLVLSFYGCYKRDAIVVTEIVKVPVLVVAETPTPIKVTKMPLPIDSLTVESSKQEIATAILETIIILKTEVKQLEASIEPFNNEEQE